MDGRTCTRCEASKPAEAFNKAARYAGGLRSWCRDCEREYRRERKATKPPVPVAVAQKRCVRCEATKTSDAFGPDGMASDGLRSWCRDCNRDYQREWSAVQRQTSPEFVERQRERCREAARKRRADPKRRAAISEAHKARRRTNPAWAEKCRQRSTRRYLAVRDTVDYKVMRRCAEHRRRARKRQADTGTFTADDWSTIVAAYGGRCAYCDQVAPLVQEHVIPLVQGGAHDRSNIVPACVPCNSRKGKRTPEQAGMQIIERRYPPGDERGTMRSTN